MVEGSRSRPRTYCTFMYRQVQFSTSLPHKRWQTSAFQTVTSRMEERPCWADPKVGGHFVRAISQNKKVKNSSNLGITLSVTGSNLYQGNKNKRNNNILGQGGSRKGAFKTEYQRTFDSAVVV